MRNERRESKRVERRNSKLALQQGMRRINLEEAALEDLRAMKIVRNNTVKTSKYHWYNFLPLNLFEQFTTKLANMYFLVIMFMQLIERISITNG